jgi:hypothetical protein
MQVGRKNRVKKAVEALRSGSDNTRSTRGRTAVLILVPLAIIGGFVVSRKLRGKNGEQADAETGAGETTAATA